MLNIITVVLLMSSQEIFLDKQTKIDIIKYHDAGKGHEIP